MAQTSVPFPAWLQEVAVRAQREGISEPTIRDAFNGLTPDPRVLELDDRQPEFTRTFWQYIDNAIADTRVTEGRQRLTQHRALLDRVAGQYGVPGRYLVAFWGLETNYGGFLGDFDAIRSLATLAYNGRRAELFGAELINALYLVDAGWVRRDQLRGSWAGALGNTQFLPSTYRRFAVDYDGDGRRDLFASLPDAFGSSANYLASLGWDEDYIWGREVVLPPTFPWDQAELSVQRPLADWQALGVRPIEGGALPIAPIQASVLIPQGHQGPAFLVYNNFRVIMQWNRSVPYAIAVGHLADRIAGAPPLRGPRPNHGAPLSLDEVAELQQRLATRGFDPGEPDGRIGPRTRGALRDWQRTVGLPQDGYPTRAILTRLRGV